MAYILSIKFGGWQGRLRLIWNGAGNGEMPFQSLLRHVDAVLGPQAASSIDFLAAVRSACREAGFDPVIRPIPIRPGAHYHMGGILVDQAGRTSIEGLWAGGEAA